ncbi:hypothetical protein [Rhodopila sp.]|uniref:hypothetical protein n=1 Tax=Rhodopila sp. TaxID=2480087 RepID=UPI003D0F8AA5
MKIVQTWIWGEPEGRLDSLFLNVEQIATIEVYSEDPLYDNQEIFGCITEEHVLGLTVWLITMSNGREIKVPNPWSWRTTIWKTLGIPEAVF